MCKIYICYLIKSTIALHKQSGYTYGHEASICEKYVYSFKQHHI